MSDMTVSLVLRAIDRLSGPVRKAARTVGALARETGRSGRNMRHAAAGGDRLARAQTRISRTAKDATRAVKRQEKALKRLARMRETAARRMRDKGMRRAGHLAAAGAAATAGAWGVKHMMDAAITPLREVEKAKGELATLGVKNMKAWMVAAREAQGRIAGMMAADFLRAGYDIKSALSSLTDEAAASMTTAVAWTAKATKASAQEMAPLFASAYGVFKRQYKGMSDAQFGDMTAGMVAAAVKNFKTTGAAMRQALQSAGGGAANAGMGMDQQFAILGQLQTTMEPGMAGTALKAYAAKAAEAQQRLRKQGVKVNLLDKKGMLRDMATVMAELRKVFGKTLDAREAAQIQKAFGSEEAVRLISALWGQEKALRANVKVIREAGAAGRQAAITMALRGQKNLDARLVLLGQKWNLLKQQMGEALAPMINKLIPVLSAIIDKMSALITAHPKIAAGVGAVVAGFGALLAVAGPLMMALSSLVGSLTMAAFALRLMRAAKLRGMAAEMAELGVSMGRVRPLKWRKLIPKLAWKAFISPIRWAGLAGRLGWRALTAPLKWTARLIPRIPWLRMGGRMKWSALVRPLKWGAKLLPKIPWSGLLKKLPWSLLITPLKWTARLIPRIPWLRMGGRMKWSALIRPLKWGTKLLPKIPWSGLLSKLPWSLLITPLKWTSRLIPGIGWAALLAELAWDLLIKPLGWDKYLSLSALSSAWSRVKAFFANIDWLAMIKRINWVNIALFGLPGVVAEIVRAFTGIDLTAAGRKILGSLWEGMKSIARGLLDWARGVASKIAGAFRVSTGTAGRGAAAPLSGRAAAIAQARAASQKKAAGGWMRGGLPTLVGERGPELIFPRRGGWVASNDNLRRFAARAAHARREALKMAAAAAAAAPLVTLSPQLAAASPAPARGAAADVMKAGTAAQTLNMTVHVTVNARTDASAGDIARQVDAHLRKAARSMLGDLQNGGAA